MDLDREAIIRKRLSKCYRRADDVYVINGKEYDAIDVERNKTKFIDSLPGDELLWLMQEDLDPRFAQMVQDNFWSLLA